MDEQFEFYAFISYSHRDMKWGKWLQNRLETYRLPAAVAGQYGELPLPMKVFRDQTDLAGNVLESSLFRTLDRARNLVVICSPDSAGSSYVEEEIAYFQSLGRADRIFAFVVSGEPDSEMPEQECLPKALRGIGLTQLHNVCELGRNNAFYSLFAALLDIRFDQIAAEERRRKRRRIALTAALSAAVLAISAAAGIYLKTEAEKQKVQSRELYFSAMYYLFDPEGTGEFGQALEYAQKAADAGNTDAMRMMGLLYRNGYRVETDSEQAFFWFQRAVDSGDIECMNELGYCYKNGIGVETDFEQVFSWYRKAAEAGSSTGMNNLGTCYQNGIGVEPDGDQAFFWYRKAVEAGDEIAMYNLASCYADGIGTEANLELTISWMQKAAEAGAAPAMVALAMIYEGGYCRGMDAQQAFFWYQKAAEEYDNSGMYNLARCYENGIGTEADAEQALRWYREAADRGNENAAEALRQAEGNG